MSCLELNTGNLSYLGFQRGNVSCMGLQRGNTPLSCLQVQVARQREHMSLSCRLGLQSRNVSFGGLYRGNIFAAEKERVLFGVAGTEGTCLVCGVAEMAHI